MSTPQNMSVLSHNGSDSPVPPNIEEMLLQQARTFSKRLLDVEEGFSDKIQKIDLRIEDIYTIVKDVARLHESSVTQSEAIDNMRQSVSDQSRKMTVSIEKIQARLDNLQDSLNQSICDETRDIQDSVTELGEKHENLEGRFSMWLNRGLGAWTVSALIIAGLQFAGASWIESLENERKQANSKIEKLAGRVTDLEHQLLTVMDDRTGRR